MCAELTFRVQYDLLFRIFGMGSIFRFVNASKGAAEARRRARDLSGGCCRSLGRSARAGGREAGAWRNLRLSAGGAALPFSSSM
ncbi:hypothetical protein chiPu_0011132 [Chiloscyllium punctatum]|uniref:Uncharacterized protein n=1 Tax=Chiloscyllium punctatum TaxID=137246 RepID=A0A401SQK7_CHIPU|nr:hypothetical protein [Chiloscyllium punctatum]